MFMDIISKGITPSTFLPEYKNYSEIMKKKNPFAMTPYHGIGIRRLAD